MSNRFHNKNHRHNHHTDATGGEPDSAHDPIASPEDPFQGTFSVQGQVSASSLFAENITGGYVIERAAYLGGDFALIGGVKDTYTRLNNTIDIQTYRSTNYYIADGGSSVNIGSYLKSQGGHCTIVGSHSKAYNGSSVSLYGYNNSSLGDYAIGIGSGNRCGNYISGEYNTGIGFNNQVDNADNTTAIGNDNVIWGGERTIAIGVSNRLATYGEPLGDRNIVIGTDNELLCSDELYNPDCSECTIVGTGNKSITLSENEPDPHYTTVIGSSNQFSGEFELVIGTRNNAYLWPGLHSNAEKSITIGNFNNNYGRISGNISTTVGSYNNQYGQWYGSHQTFGINNNNYSNAGYSGVTIGIHNQNPGSNCYLFGSGNESSSSANRATALGSANRFYGEDQTGVGEHNYLYGDDNYAFGYNNETDGTHAYAYGRDNVVNGWSTCVYGRSNEVNDSTDGYTYGEYNRSSDDYQHVIVGRMNVGVNTAYSTTLGRGNSAEHNGVSHIFGSTNYNSGDVSTLVGHVNHCSSINTTILGEYNKVDSRYSIVVGSDNTVNKDIETGDGNNLVVGIGQTCSGENNSIIGQGNCGLDNGVGSVTLSGWATIIGSHNHRSGHNDIVVGRNTVAIGMSNNSGITTDENTVTIGTGNRTVGQWSTSMGRNIQTLGEYSCGFGHDLVVGGDWSCVYGHNITNDKDHVLEIGPSDDSKLTIVQANKHVIFPPADGTAGTTDIPNNGFTLFLLNDEIYATSRDGVGALTTRSLEITGESGGSGTYPYAIEQIGTGYVGANKAIGTLGTNALDIQSSRSGTTKIAAGINSLAIGMDTRASGISSIAIGSGLDNSVDNSVEIGPNDDSKIAIKNSGLVFIPTSDVAPTNVAEFPTASHIAFHISDGDLLVSTVSGSSVVSAIVNTGVFS